MLKKIQLYNGEIIINFDDEKHKFWRDDGSPILSVTAATGVIDKSGALMGWAVNEMANYLITNLDLNKIKTEQEKINMIINAKTNYRTVSKKAKDVGTEIHNWINRWIRGEKPPMSEDKLVLNGVRAFLRWIEVRRVKFLETEKVVYSKEYDYAGFLDAEAEIEGKLSIIDFKSSKGIYNEMRYQVAAYQQAREEESKKKYDSRWIVKLGKVNGEFEARELDEQEKDLQAFLGALNLKKRLLELEQNAGRRIN